jgi:hypothetical protein
MRLNGHDMLKRTSTLIERRLHRLPAVWRCQKGVSLTEFALGLPILMALGTAGLEVGNYVTTMRKVSDLTAMISDNASRMGGKSVLGVRPITETEINDLLEGAALQAGALNIEQDGRIIISSIELNADGGQWIHWQRCKGGFDYSSTIGSAGDGAIGTDHDSFGEGDGVAASSQNAIMMVEFAYDYKMLVPVADLDLGPITETIAFNIRDKRDLSQIYNPDSAAISGCS